MILLILNLIDFCNVCCFSTTLYALFQVHLFLSDSKKRKYSQKKRAQEEAAKNGKIYIKRIYFSITLNYFWKSLLRNNGIAFNISFMSYVETSNQITVNAVIFPLGRIHHFHILCDKGNKHIKQYVCILMKNCLLNHR